MNLTKFLFFLSEGKRSFGNCFTIMQEKIKSLLLNNTSISAFDPYAPAVKRMYKEKNFFF